MAFIVDEETGNITLVQGDSGEYPVEDVPCDKDYTIYFGIYNEKRKPIGYEISLNINSTTNLYAWTYSTDTVYTKTEEPSVGEFLYDTNGALLDLTVSAVTSTTISTSETVITSTFYTYENEEMVEMETQPEYIEQTDSYEYEGSQLSQTGNTVTYDGDTYIEYEDEENNKYYRLDESETTTTTYTRDDTKDTQEKPEVIPTTSVTFLIPADLTNYLTVKSNEEYATYYFGIKLCSDNGYEDTLLLSDSNIGDLNTITVYPKKLEGTING